MAACRRRRTWRPWRARSWHALDARLPELERDVALLLAPKDEDENASAILEVRAGTGGDEAALFAGDLFRMYQRYAAAHGWRVEVESVSEGDAGGYKEIIASIDGRRGVRPAEVRERRAPGAARARHRDARPHPHLRRHRRRAARGRGRRDRDQRRRHPHRHLSLLRRRRPARQQDRLGGAHHPPAHRHRRHLLGEVPAPEPRPGDEGAEGPAVRRRSATALDAERAEARKSQVGSGDRSERIRTYNFPQGRVTDHRINLTLYNLPKVIEGEALDDVIDPLIAEDQAARLATLEDEFG